jgi:hypothetical protein
MIATLPKRNADHAQEEPEARADVQPQTSVGRQSYNRLRGRRPGAITKTRSREKTAVRRRCPH